MSAENILQHLCVNSVFICSSRLSDSLRQLLHLSVFVISVTLRSFYHCRDFFTVSKSIRYSFKCVHRQIRLLKLKGG